MPGTVLIVDADQGFTDSAQSALEARGCTVHVRDDAPIDLVRKLKPHVMMLNVELPKGASTGFSICSRIRRDRELKATPILLTSAEASVEALKKHAASADHADDYARKPISVDDVVTRIDRLLANVVIEDDAPQNGESDAGDAPLSDDFSSERRTEVRMTATPSAGTATPPSPPPRAPTSGNAAPAGGPPPPPPPPAARAPTLGGPTSDMANKPLKPASPADSSGMRPIPPPLKREVTTTTAPPPAPSDEVWKLVRLDEALRGIVDTAEPQAPTKATPEERLQFMRMLVRYHETRDKAFRELWSNVQQQGVELGRRAHQLAGDLAAREKRIEEVLHDRDNVHRRLVSVETEFKAFQDEITRIFRDKDAEEQQTFGRISELESFSAKLRTELEEERRKNRDHEHRLQIFQDEVEALTAEKDDAEAKVLELQSAIEELEHTRDELKARLEMTETVASERADEIERWREKYDRLAIDSEQDRQKLERDHAEALATTEHQANARIAGAEQDASDRIASLEAEQEKAITELKERQAQLLETLSATHESEVEALETERAEANTRAAELAQKIEELEQQLQQNAAEREAEVGALQADVENIEAAKDAIAKELEETAATLEATSAERDDLVQQVETTSREIASAKESIDSLETQLDDERAGHRSSREKIAELEEELESAQNEAFERLAELEKLRKAHERLTAKAQNFETSLKISEKALGVSEARVKALETENASISGEIASLRAHLPELEAQQDRLEQTIRGTNELLESEREKRSGAEDLLLQAKSRIDELDADAHHLRETHSEELREERSARATLELELESTREELSKREEELSRLYSSSGEKDSSLAKLEKELEELRAKEASARSSADSLGRDIKALEATERALLEEIDTREERASKLEAEMEQLRAAKTRAEEELDQERKRSRGMSQMNEQLKSNHAELMRRIVRSLDAALELLRRKHQDPELDALQAIAEDLAAELPGVELRSGDLPKPPSSPPKKIPPPPPPPPAKREAHAPAKAVPAPKPPVPSKPSSSKTNQPLSPPPPVVNAPVAPAPPVPTVQVKPTDLAAELIARELANEQLSVHSSDIQPIDLVDGYGVGLPEEGEPPRIRTRVLDAPLAKVLDAKIEPRAQPPAPAAPKKPRAQPPLVPAAPPSQPRSGGAAAPIGQKDEPFAALVAELHAAAAEQDAAVERARTNKHPEFDESFEDESTSTDSAAVRAHFGDNHHEQGSPWNESSNLKSWTDDTSDDAEAIFSQPPPRGRRRPIDAPEDPDDPDDRNITEIVSLDEIK